MIKNGLYSLSAKSRDGVADDVGGILIFRDGQIHGVTATMNDGKTNGFATDDRARW